MGSVAKVIEVIAEGKTIEEAVEKAAKEASKSLKNVKSVYVEGIKAAVEDGEIKNYRVNAKVTFVIE
ncbi:MAG: dodecin family protein [Rhodothermaceae bacterium]|nr:dodecin family protein [Rhodothermaceae bacterium]